jgi:hypothetical protein
MRALLWTAILCGCLAGDVAAPYVVAHERVGPILVGMTVPDLKQAASHWQLTPILTRTARGLTANFHIALEPGGLPALLAHVENEQVVRIEVRSGRFRTVEGLGIGTSLGELRQFDPGLRVEKCDSRPCVVLRPAGYTFELDASAATTSDLAQVPDTARVTRMLVAKRAVPVP